MILDRRNLLLGGASITLTLAWETASAKAPMPSAQVAGVQRFDVGDRVVTALSDGYLDLPTDVFLDLRPEEVEELLRAAFLEAAGTIRGSVNAYVVHGSDATMLVDAGAGGMFGPMLGRLKQHLESAGLTPQDIDVIALTHLHGDHYGGLVEGGAPVFPNAQVLVAEREISFWRDDRMMAQAPEQFRAGFTAARAALDAYGERIAPIAAEGPVPGGLEAVALPGHTPGQTGFLVSSGEDAILIWADVVHAAPLQFPRPDVSLAFDVDPRQAAETRRRAFDRAAAERIRVAGMHLPFPGIGHVVKRGEAYEYEPARWAYEL